MQSSHSSTTGNTMTKTNVFGILTVVCVLMTGILYDIAPVMMLGLIWSMAILSALFGCCTFVCYLNGDDFP